MLERNIILHEALGEIGLSFCRFCNFLRKDLCKKVPTGESEKEEGYKRDRNDSNIDTIRERPQRALCIFSAEQDPGQQNADQAYCKIEEKEFYLKMCLKERWSSRELIRQIDSAYFERFMLSQKPDNLVKIEQDKLAVPLDDIHRHLRDEYILEFLDLSETFSEKELRKAILENIRAFFLEFGKNLTFVGEEYPLVVDDETFRIDTAEGTLVQASIVGLPRLRPEGESRD